MAARAFQPARLRLARELRGIPQNKLALDIGVSAAAVSQYEAGASTPSVETLERLAIALGCAPDFFARPLRQVAEGPPFFRSRRSTPQKEQDKAEYAIVLAEAAAALERWIEMPPWASLDTRLPIDQNAARSRRTGCR